MSERARAGFCEAAVVSAAGAFECCWDTTCGKLDELSSSFVENFSVRGMTSVT